MILSRAHNSKYLPAAIDKYERWPLKKFIDTVYYDQGAEFREMVLTCILNSGFLAVTDSGDNIKFILSGQHPHHKITKRDLRALTILNHIAEFCGWPPVYISNPNKVAQVKQNEKKGPRTNVRLVYVEINDSEIYCSIVVIYHGIQILNGPELLSVVVGLK